MPAEGPAPLGLAFGQEAGPVHAAAVGYDWLRFSACCGRAGEARGARTERGSGFASRGEGPGRWRRRRRRRWRRGPVLDPAG